MRSLKELEALEAFRDKSRLRGDELLKAFDALKREPDVLFQYPISYNGMRDSVRAVK